MRSHSSASRRGTGPRHVISLRRARASRPPIASTASGAVPWIAPSMTSICSALARASATLSLSLIVVLLVVRPRRVVLGEQRHQLGALVGGHRQQGVGREARVLDLYAQPVRHLLAVAELQEDLQEPVAVLAHRERPLLPALRVPHRGEPAAVDHGLVVPERRAPV